MVTYADVTIATTHTYIFQVVVSVVYWTYFYCEYNFSIFFALKMAFTVSRFSQIIAV